MLELELVRVVDPHWDACAHHQGLSQRVVTAGGHGASSADAAGSQRLLRMLNRVRPIPSHFLKQSSLEWAVEGQEISFTTQMGNMPSRLYWDVVRKK